VPLTSLEKLFLGSSSGKRSLFLPQIELYVRIFGCVGDVVPNFKASLHNLFLHERKLF